MLSFFQVCFFFSNHSFHSTFYTVFLCFFAFSAVFTVFRDVLPVIVGLSACQCFLGGWGGGGWGEEGP